MPILGLTTNRPPTFPKIGILRKGAEKPTTGNRPGADLEHFRFDTDDQGAADMFLQTYGTEPNDISVFLPYPTVEQNFDAWREAWLKGGLLHRCNGETTARIRVKDGYSTEPQPCPGGCKPVGRLAVIIPALKRLAYVTVQTTSIHDIGTLQANLEAAFLLRHDLTGIPFILSRRAREISMPDSNGGRVRRVKWLLQIEPDPKWVELQLAATAHAALPVAQPSRLLTDQQHGYDEVEQDDQDGTEAPQSEPQLTPNQRVASIRAIRQMMAAYLELTGEQSPNLAAQLDRLPDAVLIEIGAAERQRLKQAQADQAAAQAQLDAQPDQPAEDEETYTIDEESDQELGAVYDPASATV